MPPSAGPAGARPAVGDRAGDFVLPDAEGRPTGLSSFRGRKLILYFYPAAATPGCTREATDFRDRLPEFTAAGYAVVGISPDPPEALRRFRDSAALTFPLLSDPDHTVAAAYGAWGEKLNYGRRTVGLIRSTVVLDAEGVVEAGYHNVKATGHVDRLRRDLLG
ncbi:MAG TPA: peroxiredoxin [Mycobacteriales bacterium]|nr:peroxiredoxin [Mycobacteriales bacterium]